MNSLQSKFLLAVAGSLISPQPYGTAQDVTHALNPNAEERSELTRADGGSVVGVQKDCKHFIACNGQAIEIGPADRVISTNKTCNVGDVFSDNRPRPNEADAPGGPGGTDIDNCPNRLPSQNWKPPQ